MCRSGPKALESTDTPEPATHPEARCRMTEMRLQLQARAREALASLRHAQETDDSYLATVRIAELEGLRRLAH